MRLLIAGPRDAGPENFLRIREEIQAQKATTVITGGATGVDALAARAAASLFLESLVFPANWATLGKAAGPARNLLMLIDGRPDLVLVYRYPGQVLTPGSADMSRQALRQKVTLEYRELLSSSPTKENRYE